MILKLILPPISMVFMIIELKIGPSHLLNIKTECLYLILNSNPDNPVLREKRTLVNTNEVNNSFSQNQ